LWDLHIEVLGDGGLVHFLDIHYVHNKLYLYLGERYHTRSTRAGRWMIWMTACTATITGTHASTVIRRI